jgi:2-C-methyl-D-erythritol 2,4-cyclodiphosphate synthase
MAATAAAAAVEAPTAPVLPYRVGHGFDLHRLAEGYKLIIGGVEIPHTKGCEAHSDGGRQAAREAVSHAAAHMRQLLQKHGSWIAAAETAAAAASSLSSTPPL